MILVDGDRKSNNILINNSLSIYYILDKMSLEEEVFFNKIKDKINVVFDVGTYKDSLYVKYSGEVHYFEPYKEYIEELKKLPNNNKLSVFNNFGLGDESSFFDFWVNGYSFVKRPHSTGSPVKCEIQRGDEYCKKK
jgi:hypothetical protein